MTTMLLISFLGLFGCFRGVNSAPTPAGQTAPAISFHSLMATDIHGQPYSFAALKGHKVMLVNTASECGYTPQYKQLQELHEAFKEKGLIIVGFPCNQFGGQEPGTEQEIEAFCQKNYGVAFPMMGKVEVKGAQQHPVYQWLTRKEQNGAMDASVKWNFHKFLVDEDGRLAHSLGSGVSPLDELVLNWLEGR
jgi:glutathione peroxidase